MLGGFRVLDTGGNRMPVLIDVPTTSTYVRQNIVLNGLNYVFSYKFNSRDERWRLSIYRNDEAIVESIKILENQFLLGQYILDGFEGDILCFRSLESTDKPVTLGTLGIGKDYELIYYTLQDLLELAEDE